MSKESDVMNRAERRRRAPAKPRQVAGYGHAESAARLMRKVGRRLRNMRTFDTGLFGLDDSHLLAPRRCDGAPRLSAGLPANAVGLDESFGIANPLHLLAFAVGREGFNYDERRRRRAQGKRQRAARRAGR